MDVLERCSNFVMQFEQCKISSPFQFNALEVTITNDVGYQYIFAVIVFCDVFGSVGYKRAASAVFTQRRRTVMWL